MEETNLTKNCLFQKSVVRLCWVWKYWRQREKERWRKLQSRQERELIESSFTLFNEDVIKYSYNEILLKIPGVDISPETKVSLYLFYM